MRFRTATTVAAIAAAGLLVLTGCADSGAPTGEEPRAPTSETVPYEDGTTMADLAEAGTITIGTKFAQPLFGLAGPDGIPVGFDIEIGKIIARHLGIDAENIEWVETVSANREPFIQSGEVDIVIATYTINDTRKEVVSFAGPYYEAGQDILVPVGQPRGDRRTRLVRRQPGRHGLHGERLDVADEHPGVHHERPRGRGLRRLPRPDPQRPGRRGDDGQRHPGRPRRPE